MKWDEQLQESMSEALRIVCKSRVALMSNSDALPSESLTSLFPIKKMWWKLET